MPVLGVHEMPGIYRNLYEAQLGKDFLAENYWRSEVEKKFNVKMIGGVSQHPPSLLWSQNPVRKMEDFARLTVRVYSPEGASIFDALGSSTITMPSAWSPKASIW